MIKQFLIVALGMLLFVSGCSDDDDVTRQLDVIVKPVYVVPTAEQATTTGTVPVDEGNYKLGEQITFLGNPGNLTRTTGATFEGWMVAGSTTVYHEGDVATIPTTLPSSTYTITVKWPQRVTYNGNGSTGGTAPTDATFYATNATVTAATQGTLVRTGYTFNGWNTAANGTGTARAAGSDFAMGLTALTLFAQWTGNPYTLTYDGNGNTGGTVPDGATHAAGSAVTADNNTGSLTRTDHAFLGWNTAADGSGTNVAAGATFNMFTANTTLYAKWNALVCTVTYNGNGNTGGTVPIDATIYQQGQTVPVATKGTLTKAGSNFIAWNTAPDGSGTSYLGGPNSSFIMGATSVTLYAIWAP